MSENSNELNGPARERPEFYLRVSSDDQPRSDVGEQLRAAERFADGLGYQVVARVVEVETDYLPMASDPLAGLQKGIVEFLKEEHSQDIRQGLRRAAQQGYWVSSRVPYGYRKVAAGDSGRRRWKLEIAPEAAVVVREMYRRVRQGTLPQTIVSELNDAGVASPSGGMWTLAQVLAILADPVNAGVAVVGKNSGEPLEVRDAHPKIVCWAMFEEVQELLGPAGSELMP